MSTVYAEPGLARTALDRLKDVAAKWKKKQLHLPAFLEIDSSATHDEWRARLGERSRRFRNQAQKAGQRQSVDLCIFLETHFKDEESWRGLLNQLGRLHVEGRVEQLAEAAPAPDLVRQSFNVLAHEAGALVGAPDAEAVIRDLFDAHGLEATEPQPEPEAPPAEETPEPEPEREPDPEPDEPAGRPSSPWAAFGNLLLTGAVEVLKARAAVARHQIASDVETFKQTVQIAGTWWGEEGACLSFAQRGVQVMLQGQAMGQGVSGQGIVRGRQVELMAWLLPQRARMSVLLDVSPDGSTMRGTARDDHGRTMPVNLRR
jgi:hypothetical protein